MRLSKPSGGVKVVAVYVIGILVVLGIMWIVAILARS